MEQILLLSVTVFKQRANRLASLNSRLIGIKLVTFGKCKKLKPLGLVLGQLHGNRFTITLRGVVADSEDTVKAAADALGKHGFINYFGMQRFGTGSVPTHLIGAKLLRGEWKEADDIRRIREYYKESEDIDGTLRQLPRFLVAEKAIVTAVLKKSPGNYLQAMKAVPRTLRMMYVHSYQSYLWNHAASMRVQKYGYDLKHASVAYIMHPVNVFVVNSEDLASGRYTYTDVVLPLPGSRVIYPQNDIEQCYQDLANKVCCLVLLKCMCVCIYIYNIYYIIMHEGMILKS
ncbi:putative tRNA pseudouridine(13) synthase [Helianthus annuus]|nr:putative tRNA pseudouridine(13) synthase [Helianthus annuus]